MNLLWHQLRTDLRAHRFLLAISIPLALGGPWLGTQLALVLPGELGDIAKVGLGLAVLLTAFLSATAPIGAASFVGSTAFWRTRPITQATQFQARSLWILLLVMVPIALGIGISLPVFHLTAAQAAIVFFTLTGVAVTLLVLAATLRAAREGFWQFRLQLAISIGLFVASTFLLALFLRWQGGLRVPAQVGSSIFLATMVSLILALVAWCLVARFRRPRAALVASFLAVFVFPWLLALWSHPFIKPPVLPTHALVMTLVEPDEIRTKSHPDGQVLWENLLVEGLAPRQLFLPRNTAAQWTPPGTAPGFPLEIPGGRVSSPLQAVSDILPPSDIWSRIKPDFPAETTWTIEARHQFRQRLSRSGRQTTVKGTLSVQTEGLVIEPRRLAELSLRNGARAPLAGGGLATVQKPEWNDGTLRFNLQFIQLFRFRRSAWSPEGRHLVSPFDNLCYVFYHRPSGTVIATTKDSGSGRSGPVGLLGKTSRRMEIFPSRLYLAVHGLDAGRWAAETELHIYTLVPLASFRSPSLLHTDYQLNPSGEEPRRGETKGFAAATLPENPSPAQIDAYLDTVIYGGPDRQGDQPYFEKLRALPPPGLMALAKRLPVRDFPNRAAQRVLEKHPADIPPEVLLDGLRRDPRFVTVCVKKGLGSEAAAILRARLREHRSLPPEAAPAIFKVVIGQTPLDAGLRADLHWHFVHANYKQGQIAPLLAKLEGFDFPSALAEAWATRRVDSNNENYDLIPYALVLGDKEALRLTLRQLQGKIPKWQRTRNLQLLAPRLATDLASDDAFRWAVEHYPELSFDPATGKFGMEGG